MPSCPFLWSFFLLDCEEKAIAVCVVPFIKLMIVNIPVHIVRQVIMYIQNNIS